MNFNEYNELCATLPAATYVMQWGGSHVWKVGGKVFCIGGGTPDYPAYSFKAGEIGFMLLPEKPGYRPAPYLASRGLKWIQAEAGQVDREELRGLIRDSYFRVVAGLSRKKRRELGLEPAQPKAFSREAKKGAER
jgi:predicted DNA-binding protein (MmcQ/YjbR family)